MNLDYLDFEQPIAELDGKIHELRNVGDGNDVDLTEEIAKLQQKIKQLTRQIFSELTPWQVAQVARHPKRPHMLDYVRHLFTEFEELHGDRHFGDDRALIGGLARFNGKPVMVIGQQKGRDTKEKVTRNFGMPRPEGYRKALRLAKTAERFKLPVITFIDTPGAYPGIGAEERNQSEAIARNLFEFSKLRTPIVAIVTGEGGSGGALAIGVADSVAMLQFSIYSVISPEGCASILWKSADKAEEAAMAMNLTAKRSLKNNLIDAVIKEPSGGAHRNHQVCAEAVGRHIKSALKEFKGMEMDALLERRYARLMAYGDFKDA